MRAQPWKNALDVRFGFFPGIQDNRLYCRPQEHPIVLVTSMAPQACSFRNHRLAAVEIHRSVKGTGLIFAFP